MLVYAVRRLLLAIPVLLAASLFVFLLVDTSGDPLAGLRAADPPISPQVIDAEEARLYLDRSPPERYWLWLTGVDRVPVPGQRAEARLRDLQDARAQDVTIDGLAVGVRLTAPTRGDIGLLRGEFGPSTRSAGEFAIGERMRRTFFITLRLVLVAALGSVLLGIITGVVSAVRQYSKLDHTLTFVGFVALAMPVFWLAALIKQGGHLLNENVFGRTVLFTIGAATPDTRGWTGWEIFTDSLGHLILPTLTLILTGYAVISRFQRASMLEVLNSDYVRLARAKGVRNRQVMRRHALRTALIPVTTLSVIVIVTLIDGAVLTETVFEWRGMGRFLLESVRETDSYAVMGWLLISGILIIVANLVADLLYGVLDPRIRYE